MATVSTVATPVELAATGSTRMYTFDPLSDQRWDNLVASHPRASAFHQTGWLRALASTYGYRPLVLTSTPPGQRLQSGIVFCEVQSWLTGSRLVSLPFSDHCEPLLDVADESPEMLEWMRTERAQRNWKYIELRPTSWMPSPGSALTASQSYWIHNLDLTPPLDNIFGHLHKNSIQRRIAKAEREQLAYEAGSSEALVDDFYRLLLITRRRHRLLPQPRAWFDNLIRHLGQSVQIRVASHEGVPIAALLALRHRATVVYKYGCSDERFHHLAAMPFLFWKMIVENKATGAEEVDLGRTDLENQGLITFKDRFGTVRKELKYFRYPETFSANGGMVSHLSGGRRAFSLLPDALLRWAGRVAYRHIG
jgi:CelD/BcsL family acetyltransferase involved in cellulose biosynthesis